VHLAKFIGDTVLASIALRLPITTTGSWFNRHIGYAAQTQKCSKYK
jgi:hypothetical protein